MVGWGAGRKRQTNRRLRKMLKTGRICVQETRRWQISPVFRGGLSRFIEPRI